MPRRPLSGERFCCGCGLLVLVIVLLSLPPRVLAGPRAGVPAAIAGPTITLDPSSGPCPVANQQQVTVRGRGFTPGVTVRFILRRDRDGAITAANTQGGGLPAEADGTFVRAIPLVGCGPDEPAGSTFTITMYEYRPNDTPPRGPEASAIFTVTAIGASYPGLPSTGGGGVQDRARLPAGLPVAVGLLADLAVALGVGRRHGRRGRAVLS